MRLVLPESVGPMIAMTRDVPARSTLDASAGVSVSAPGSAILARTRTRRFCAVTFALSLAAVLRTGIEV